LLWAQLSEEDKNAIMEKGKHGIKVGLPRCVDKAAVFIVFTLRVLQ
jgi:hypothetical protein|tara:strand:+ start:516 stop:653 length:138 start_codon:yes stop_codon:yes gene_type:complete